MYILYIIYIYMYSVYIYITIDMYLPTIITDISCCIAPKAAGSLTARRSRGAVHFCGGAFRNPQKL